MSYVKCEVHTGAGMYMPTASGMSTLAAAFETNVMSLRLSNPPIYVAMTNAPRFSPCRIEHLKNVRSRDDELLSAW